MPRIRYIQRFIHSGKLNGAEKLPNVASEMLNKLKTSTFQAAKTRKHGIRQPQTPWQWKTKKPRKLS